MHTQQSARCFSRRSTRISDPNHPEKTKFCSLCRKRKPATSEFFWIKGGKVCTYCKPCDSERKKKNYRKFVAANGPGSWHKKYAGDKQKLREHDRKRNLRRKYNLSPQVFEMLKQEQMGLCGICGKKLGEGRSVAVDHDHKTDTVRGVLCNKCNAGLGFFEDNPGNLLAAIFYLRKGRLLNDLKKSGLDPIMTWIKEAPVQSEPEGSFRFHEIKLTNEIAKTIRFDCHDNKLSVSEVAEKYKISFATAANTLRGETWKMAGGPILKPSLKKTHNDDPETFRWTMPETPEPSGQENTQVRTSGRLPDRRRMLFPAGGRPNARGEKK